MNNFKCFLMVFATLYTLHGQANNYTSFTDTDKSEKLKQLTPLQVDVTQNGATEKPFENLYWDNKAQGIYVDIVSGEPLFSSTDKYDAKTGWPSFSKPINSQFIILNKHRKLLFFSETEVRSKIANSHLGDVFNDGPKPLGLRYCLDSASLRFIPKNNMEKEGYGQYLYLFH